MHPRHIKTFKSISGFPHKERMNIAVISDKKQNILDKKVEQVLSSKTTIRDVCSLLRIIVASFEALSNG